MQRCALTQRSGTLGAASLRPARCRQRAWRPFTTARPATPTANPSPQQEAHQSHHPSPQQPSFHWQLVHTLATVALPLSLAASYPALADEAPLEITAATDAVTAASAPGGASDLVVTLIFTVVVGLLAIVTAGMIYLAIMQSLDKKQEIEDQQASKSKLKTVPTAAGSASSSTEQERLPAAFRPKAKRDKTKGFGDS